MQYFEKFKTLIIPKRKSQDFVIDEGNDWWKFIEKDSKNESKSYSVKIRQPKHSIAFQADGENGNNSLDTFKDDIPLPDFISFCEEKDRIYYFMIELKYGFVSDDDTKDDRKEVNDKFWLGYHLINIIHARLLSLLKDAGLKSKNCFIVGVLIFNIKKVPKGNIISSQLPLTNHNIKLEFTKLTAPKCDGLCLDINLEKHPQINMGVLVNELNKMNAWEMR